MTFTGDIAFTKYFSFPIQPPLVDDAIASFLSKTDYCVGNIEGPFVYNSINQAEFLHSSMIEAGPIIRTMGIDVWNLANNHALDFGEEGIITTLEVSSQNDCKAIGVGLRNIKQNDPLIITEGGGLGLLSVTYTEPKMLETERCDYIDWDDLERIKRTINAIKSKFRWCVVIVHGGDEFSDLPMPETRQKYIKYLAYGADIVIGHHPHVVQNYEEFNNKIIFYSLGNFIFDTDYQRNQKHTDIGVLIQFHFSEKQFYWEYMPIKIDRTNKKIIKTERPVVFTNIEKEQYNILWPFAARGLCGAEMNNRIYLNPGKYRHYSRIKWVMRDAKLMMNKKNRDRVLGKYLSYILLHKVKDKELLSYLIKH